MKLRWGNIVKDKLPISLLPLSALWRCRAGTGDNYALGCCKDFREYSTNYVICDVKVCMPRTNTIGKAVQRFKQDFPRFHFIAYILHFQYIDFEQLTASADVFYPGDDDATFVENIYLHELSLVNLESAEENDEGLEDVNGGKSCGAEHMNEAEIMAINTVLDHLRFFYTVIW